MKGGKIMSTHKKTILLTCFFAMSIFFLLACENFPTIPPSSTTKPVPRYEQTEISGPLLAQVNAWRIGLEDFEKRLKVLEPIAAQQNLDINDYDFKRKAL